MTNGIYGGTLAVLGELVTLVDSIGDALDDVGLAFEAIPLTNSTQDQYVGVISFDEDKHPYFIPAD